MKKMKRRILSLVLSLALFFAIPMSASADVVEDAPYPTAKMEWDVTIGTETLTLCFPEESYTIPVSIKDASYVDIENGAQGVVTWPVGYCATREPEYAGTPSPLNRDYLESLAIELDYEIKSMSSVTPNYIYFNIPAGLLSGRYSYGVECEVIDAEWWISKWQSGIVRAAPSVEYDDDGEIIGIPLSMTNLKLIVIYLN